MDYVNEMESEQLSDTSNPLMTTIVFTVALGLFLLWK